jgi:hypothetical protein
MEALREGRSREALAGGAASVPGAGAGLHHLLLRRGGRGRRHIVKPILDAIVGLAYLDDDQVTDLLSRKRILDGVRVGQVSDVLAEGFGRGRDFLHVLVAPASGQEID